MFSPLQHQRRAKLLRQRAQKWPQPKKARALKLAGVHQARAQYQPELPEQPKTEGKPQLVIPGPPASNIIPSSFRSDLQTSPRFQI